jgi:hypothetical protein
MPSGVDRPADRVVITLDPGHAARLARLARLADLPVDTLAGSLLSTAIEEADPDAGTIAALLDGIPGAYGRAIRAREQADAGQVIDLDDL